MKNEEINKQEQISEDKLANGELEEVVGGINLDALSSLDTTEVAIASTNRNQDHYYVVY